MGVEIERKFLVEGDAWRADALDETPIRQGYLSKDARRSIRVRVIADRAVLTIKSKAQNERAQALRRAEFEYEIPLRDGEHLLETVCDAPIIEKRRSRVKGPDGEVWEVDEFVSPHRGLVLAEIELESDDAAFARPDWLGAEVTHDARYSNAEIATAKLD